MPELSLSGENKQRLTECIDSGVRVLQEIADLRDGLKDTVKTLAEEIGVKPIIIQKTIRVAFKATIQQERETVDIVEEILEATGHR